MAVGWLDPAIDSQNAGDAIISESVDRELRTWASDQLVYRLPTQRSWTAEERGAARQCSTFFVGGTNLLTSNPVRYRQWVYGVRDEAVLRGKCVLFGVGWWQYQRPPNRVARAALKRVLSTEMVHGVRDSYTVHQLGNAGIPAINIGCPTLWHAQTAGCSQHGFRATIVATVTDYMKDYMRDGLLLARLRDRSDRLLIWPQGSGDIPYVKSIGFGAYLMDSGIAALDDALAMPGVEYVGTRLHGGIRALCAGIPTVVIAVDNRATEMARDFNFWSMQRSDVRQVDEVLDGLDSWSLRLPWEAIEEFRLAATVQVN